MPGVGLDIVKPDLDLIPDVDRAVIVPFTRSDQTFALESDVDDELAAGSSDDAAGQDGSRLEFVVVLLDHAVDGGVTIGIRE